MVNIRSRELCLLHVDTAPFSFNANVPRIELGDSLLLGVCDEQQVISVEKLQRHTSAELTQKHLQHKDEEQWAKDRALMHTDSNPKLPIVLTIDSCTPPWIRLHILYDMHRPFLNTEVPESPPMNLSWRMINSLLSVNGGKAGPFVSNDVLLQLANNDDGISGTSTRHKGKLPLGDVHHLGEVEV